MEVDDMFSCFSTKRKRPPISNEITDNTEKKLRKDEQISEEAKPVEESKDSSEIDQPIEILTEVPEVATEQKSFGSVNIFQVNVQGNCTHEVAVVEGVPYESLKESNEEPAKVYPFQLDSFQKEAIKCIENDHSVLVAAHTSSGKTVVAEYAIARCLKNFQRVIYTSPIKALSNQKFRELSEQFQDVGLQTGDVTINPNAGCVVMTTEILRSMLYRGSEIIREMAWVIFDEIHYMRDAERGVVWEETIIFLPDNVHYVFLSATLPNCLQFAEWISVIHRQPCHVVSTDTRPTPLHHFVYPVGGDGLYLVVNEKQQFHDENFARAMSALNESTEASNQDNQQNISGSGFAKRTNSKMSVAMADNVLAVVRLIMNRNLAPAIIFSFSKRECECYALKVGDLNFNDDMERKMIEQVFNNATECLSEEDKKLPQVEHVLPLLQKGIGIHHSGLLPILKEVTEILFSEGLIKVLFATETFSMGLNMPARTVVFTSVSKFDGKRSRWVSSGEYIQMSGRAGRRGIDDKGLTILMMDQRLPKDAAKDLMIGRSDPLNSAFRLTYSMILNLIRLEGVNPEYMMEKSFHQYQMFCKMPNHQKRIKNLEEQYKRIEISDEQSLSNYVNLRDQLETLREKMLEFIRDPLYLVPFLQPGRLVKFKCDGLEYDWGAVVNYHKKVGKNNVESDGKSRYVMEVLVNCSTKTTHTVSGELPLPCQKDEAGVMLVAPVLTSSLIAISCIRVNLPKDLKPSDARKAVGLAIKEIEKKFSNEIPLLDPVEDMKIATNEFSKIIENISKTEERLFKNTFYQRIHEVSQASSSGEVAIKSSTSDDRLDSSKVQLELFQKKADLAAEICREKHAMKRLQSSSQLNDLRSRKRVLRRLGFISASDIVELKGRVACEISCADELVLSEMLFNGVFNDLSPSHINALLSCFVCESNKPSDQRPSVYSQLAGPLNALQETVKRVSNVFQEAKIDFDPVAYSNSFSTEMMDVTFQWSNGASFAELCKLTSSFEGNIIRCLKRLDELLRQMCQAAKCIGNSELEVKFSEGISKIKRDIVFAASLYL